VLEHGQQCFANMIFDLILREWFSISIGCFRRTGFSLGFNEQCTALFGRNNINSFLFGKKSMLYLKAHFIQFGANGLHHVVFGKNKASPLLFRSKRPTVVHFDRLKTIAIVVRRNRCFKNSTPVSRIEAKATLARSISAPTLSDGMIESLFRRSICG
jgi:hypothetical protein